jgi:NDP-4-keto-2,6-dideoxyhexose 3-C-methyltransferase
MNCQTLQIHEHLKCRLCHSDELAEVLDIGSQYVNNFVSHGEWSGIYCPLVIDHCLNCDLYQLRHTAPQELLYKGTYWYKSGVTDFMTSHLKELAQDISASLDDKSLCSVLDIGANDGTFLKYVDSRIKTIGVEPASNLQEELEGNCDQVYSDLWTYEFSKFIVQREGQFDYVTALGMFYDLDDPIDFVKGVSHALKDSGVFVAQLMCMQNMLNTNDLGNICHEHIEFYTLKSLKYLFDQCDLVITNISCNNVNGQSYRIKAQKRSSGVNCTPEILSQIYLESNNIEAFERNIKNSRDIVTSFIKAENAKGKITAAFGASTKGNSILQYFGLSFKEIPFCVDRSPWKTNLHTVGSWIPILHESDPNRFNADYYLVLPWGFIDEFLNREQQFLNSGGIFIVPFPQPVLISKNGTLPL